MNSEDPETNELLRAWVRGDPEALSALTPSVYGELRRMAAHSCRMSERETACKRQPWFTNYDLRLIDVQNVRGDGRAHFFAFCAQLMRRILVDAARARSAQKRGGDRGRIDLDDLPDLGGQRDKQLIALD